MVPSIQEKWPGPSTAATDRAVAVPLRRGRARPQRTGLAGLGAPPGHRRVGQGPRLSGVTVQTRAGWSASGPRSPGAGTAPRSPAAVRPTRSSSRSRTCASRRSSTAIPSGTAGWTSERSRRGASRRADVARHPPGSSVAPRADIDRCGRCRSESFATSPADVARRRRRRLLSRQDRAKKISCLSRAARMSRWFSARAWSRWRDRSPIS
jgi:hypothetical protein